MILYKYHYTSTCGTTFAELSATTDFSETKIYYDGYFESRQVFDALLKRWSVRDFKYFESDADANKNENPEMIMFDNDYFVANRSMVSRYGAEKDRMCFIEGEHKIQLPPMPNLPPIPQI